MVCIHCGNETQVTNSRPQKRVNQVWRRRKCLICAAIFSTTEAVNFTTSLRVRVRGGKLIPLERDRLFISLYKSLGHRPTALIDAGSLAATVITKVIAASHTEPIPYQSIRQAAIVALNRFDKVASTHYQAFHRR